MKEPLRFIRHTWYILPEVLGCETFFDSKIAVVLLLVPLKSVINSRMILKFIEILCWLHNNFLYLLTANMSPSLPFTFSSMDIPHFIVLAISLVAL